MPIKINSVNFDSQEFVYSLLDASGNVYLDHVPLLITTEQSLADMKTTAQADALTKKAAVKAAIQARDAALQAQITALAGAGLP